MGKQVAKFRCSGMDFSRHVSCGLDGKKTIVWMENATEMEHPFCVIVAPTGMHFSGTMSKEVEGEHALQEFAQFLSICWDDHRSLMKKLHTTLSGH